MKSFCKNVLKKWNRQTVCCWKRLYWNCKQQTICPLNSVYECRTRV